MKHEIKNTSATVYEFKELDGIVLFPGEVVDLSSYSPEKRKNCSELQSGLTKSHLVRLQSQYAVTTRSAVMEQAQKRSQTRSGSVRKTTTIFASPPQKYISAKSINKRDTQAKADYSSEVDSKEYDRYISTDKYFQDQSSDQAPQEKKRSTILRYEDVVKQKGKPIITLSNGQATVEYPKSEPGIIDTTPFIDDASVFVDNVGSEQYNVPTLDTDRIQHFLDKKCMETTNRGSLCGNNAIEGYEYCFSHMSKTIKQQYLQSKKSKKK